MNKHITLETSIRAAFWDAANHPSQASATVQHGDLTFIAMMDKRGRCGLIVWHEERDGRKTELDTSEQLSVAQAAGFASWNAIHGQDGRWIISENARELVVG